MIVAIEGPSAAGKTTWCRSHYPDLTVAAPPEDIAAPDLYDDPAKVADFWVNHNIRNWQRALAIEIEHGIAVCDGDPFHLYFSWALWKSGALPRDLFDVEARLYRHAFEQKLIGFADCILWLDAPAEELRRRSRADTTRRRKRHEMYLVLIPWMNAWFQERERLLPGTVVALKDDADLPASPPASFRYETPVFDALMNRLTPLS